MKRIINYILIISIILSALTLTSVNTSAKNTYDTVIVGDSRVVGLAKQDGVRVYKDEVNNVNKDGNIYYFGKVSKGYKWLDDNIDTIADKCSKDTIIYVAFGVNDLYNVNRYKKLFTNLSKKCNDAKVIVAEVGAVNENKEKKYGYNIKQSSVDSFNKNIKKKAKNYIVIDFWDGDESKNTTDGIHYNSTEYKNTLKQLKEQ